MDDIDALKRREIELLKQIDAAGKEKAGLLKQRDALSPEPQTPAERLACIYGMCIGILKQAGRDIDSIKLLAQFDSAMTDLGKRVGKDVATIVLAEIRKVIK